MKRALLSASVLIVLGILLTPAAVAQPVQRVAAFVDLRTGNVTILGAFASCISVVSAPFDSNGDGWLETVLKVTIDPAAAGACRTSKMCLVLDYEGASTGFSLNIGDSITNDGFGGDGGTQQNDAELQISGQTLGVYRSDLGGPGLLSQSTLALIDGGLKICISNEKVELGNPSAALTDNSLFALAGQPDTGPGGVNQDIYIGLNRVISGPGARTGTGVARALIVFAP